MLETCSSEILNLPMVIYFLLTNVLIVLIALNVNVNVNAD